MAHSRIIKDRLRPDTVKRWATGRPFLSPSYNHTTERKMKWERIYTHTHTCAHAQRVQHPRKDPLAVVARQPRLVATYGGVGAAVARKSRPPRRRLIPNNSHTLCTMRSPTSFYLETLRLSKCSYFAAHRNGCDWLAGWAAPLDVFCADAANHRDKTVVAL